ncbi:MAG: hypothetical protein KDC30_03630, partial [Saprospiraceae bacterium]|nr:hypothetical protein [Saprospiraceae bacterium]
MYTACAPVAPAHSPPVAVGLGNYYAATPGTFARAKSLQNPDLALTMSFNPAMAEPWESNPL